MNHNPQLNSSAEKPSLPLITHVCKHFYPVYGGLERFVHQLIRHTSSGFRHQVICYNDDLDGHRNRLESATVWDGIPIFRVPCLKAGWLHAAWLPARVLNESDLIHVHSMDLLLDQVIRRFSDKPMVASTHGLIFHHSRFTLLKSAYLTLSGLIRGNNPDTILASGQTDFDKCRRFFPSVPVELIPNPVQYPSSLPEPDPMDRKGVIALFRFQKNKAPDTVLSVYQSLREIGFTGPLTLVLSGDGTAISRWAYRHRFFLHTAEITLLVSIPEEEKWEKLSQSEWMIHPSEYEGFGYTIAEGLIAGCRVLVSELVYRNFGEVGPPYIQAVSFGQPQRVAALIAGSTNSTIPRFKGYTGWHWVQRSHEFSAIYRKYTQP
ncbi:MAG: glycosyltransferase family 4 protein [Bacteroidetes bacterium]|nr:glycosyltransferase family 4 protein [Bacteroidota bacterium]